MGNEKDTKKAAAAAADESAIKRLDKKVLAELLAATAPENWHVSKGTDTYLYRPEDCDKVAIQGWTVGSATHEGKGAMPDFTQVAIELTAPCVGLNRKREQQLLKPGQVVVVTTTYALQLILRAANHPTREFEVYIKPQEKIDIGDGQTLWLWDNPRFSPTTRAKVAGTRMLDEGLPPELMDGAPGPTDGRTLTAGQPAAQ